MSVVVVTALAPRGGGRSCPGRHAQHRSRGARPRTAPGRSAQKGTLRLGLGSRQKSSDLLTKYASFAANLGIDLVAILLMTYVVVPKLLAVDGASGDSRDGPGRHSSGADQTD
jgi:hypothetical protein